MIMHGIIQGFAPPTAEVVGFVLQVCTKMEESDWTSGCRSDLGLGGKEADFESSAPMVTCLRGLLEEHRTPAHAISRQGP
jgi:hypothetical protein